MKRSRPRHQSRERQLARGAVRLYGCAARCDEYDDALASHGVCNCSESNTHVSLSVSLSLSFALKRRRVNVTWRQQEPAVRAFRLLCAARARRGVHAATTTVRFQNTLWQRQQPLACRVSPRRRRRRGTCPCRCGRATTSAAYSHGLGVFHRSRGRRGRLVCDPRVGSSVAQASYEDIHKDGGQVHEQPVHGGEAAEG